FNHLRDRIKINRSFMVFGFIKFENPNIIALEATDIDYLSSSDINLNTFKTLSSTATSSLSDLSSITEEFKSTTSQTLKKHQRLVYALFSSNTISTSAMNLQKTISANTRATSDRKRKKNYLI
ncbi:24286_t:CDS:1, partial [Dentiscutata erythropus]